MEDKRGKTEKVESKKWINVFLYVFLNILSRYMLIYIFLKILGNNVNNILLENKLYDFIHYDKTSSW